MMLDRKRYVLYITKQCNLDCTYCYEKDKDSTNLSFSEISKGIDYIFSQPEIDKVKNIEIEFIGGETLLNLDGMKFACAYISDRYAGYDISRYIITTNGTILTDKVIDFINSKKIDFAISIDGTRFAHNTARHFKSDKRGSYDEVIKNAMIFKERINSDIIIAMTVHKYNVSKVCTGVLDLYEKGFRIFSIGVVKEDIDVTFASTLQDEHIKISREIIDNGMDIFISPMMDYNGKKSIQSTLQEKNEAGLIDTYEEVEELTDKNSNQQLRIYYALVENISKAWRNISSTRKDNKDE